MHCFTSEFGMGSGGSNALWSPGKLARTRSHLYNRQPDRHGGSAPLGLAARLETVCNSFSANKVVNQAVCSCVLFNTGLHHNIRRPCLPATSTDGGRVDNRTERFRPNNLDYMVKPHGQLVLVSSTPHNAYTPSLSTSWSWTALQGT